MSRYSLTIKIRSMDESEVAGLFIFSQYLIPSYEPLIRIYENTMKPATSSSFLDRFFLQCNG